jgi:hypothetical protein
MSTSFSFSWNFWSKFCMLFISHMNFAWNIHHFMFGFIHVNDIRWRVQIIKLFTLKFLQLFVTSYLVVLNIRVRTLFSDTHKTCSSFRLRKQRYQLHISSVKNLVFNCVLST